jgi:hypothetical protein
MKYRIKTPQIKDLFGTPLMIVRGHTLSYMYTSHKPKQKHEYEYEFKILAEFKIMKSKLNNQPDENVKQEYATVTQVLESR